MRWSRCALLLAAGILCVAAPGAASQRRSPIVAAVERVRAAVVNISTAEVLETDVAPFHGFRDPFFDQFFRDFFESQRRRVTRTSLGSGVIVRDDGYILTNQHVVLRASRIKVTLADEREFDAESVGSDADSDLAVLKLSGAGRLPAAVLGTSSDLMIGETVIAIGNPFGLAYGDGRCHQRGRTFTAHGRSNLFRPDSDRRVDQPGQLRRSAPEH